MKTTLLTIFISLPLFVVGVLTWLMAGSLEEQGRATSAPIAIPADPLARHRTSITDIQPEQVKPESLPQGFVIVVEDSTDIASAESPIYLASNHVGWNAGSPRMRMEPRSDGRWQIALPKPEHPGSLLFKFTRGTWDTVETAPDLSNIDNRTLPSIDPSSLEEGERPVLEFVIAGFADQRTTDNDPTEWTMEVTGDLRTMQVVGGGGSAAGMTRQLLIWLPPGYDDRENADRHYPVLYLMDGQNVFDAPPGIPGEWEADETATRLIEAGRIEPLIIVAIPHAEQARIEEYLPKPVFDGVDASGREFVEFLAREVIPRVERAFRVDAKPARRAIGGASLGGIISLQAAAQKPDLFGLVIAESPSLRASEHAMLKHFESAEAWNARVVLGVGTEELGSAPQDTPHNEEFVEVVEKLAESIREKGTQNSDVMLVIGDGARHTESAWAERLEEALLFLFGTNP